MNGTPVRPVGPVPGYGVRSAAGRMRRRLVLLAAAAAVVAIVGIGVGMQLGDHGNGSGTLAVAVLADAEGADVARVVTGDDGDVLVLDKVPPLSAGRIYQLWSVDGPRPVSLGLLGEGHDPSVPVTLPADTAMLAISEEPAGGSTMPTGPVVASGAVVRPA